MSHGARATRRLETSALARVEGEGAMLVQVDDGQVTDVQLRIYEPPRFFEGLLRGRHFSEPPDITARICGICPVAYQMSACNALEATADVEIPPRIRALRRLLYCGEWVESHVLHIAFLHAPDFLGFESGIAMAEASAALQELVRTALQLKKVGNAIVEVVGGRAIHPVNVRVGGFFRAPTRRELEPLGESLLWAQGAAAALLEWVAGFGFPDFETDDPFVALRHPDEYAVLDGRLASTSGLDVAVDEFETHVVEHQVAHSSALHAMIDGRTYQTGPLARFALNRDRLSPAARRGAADAGLGAVCRNPFQSIVVRAVEVIHACEEAIRIVEGYEAPDPPAVTVEPRRHVGRGASEAPRGTLFHRYEVAEDGSIVTARIVPPTSQNQARLEADLRRFVMTRLHLPDEELTRQCEQVIRNYDPCISCATHFLDLTVRRR